MITFLKNPLSFNPLTPRLSLQYNYFSIQNEKDNYGDEDGNGALVTQAGKVGKAQHNFFR